MPTFVKFDCFTQDLGRKVHNLNADTIKVMLTNTAPNVSTNTVKTDITEITAAHGYTAGGTAIGANAYAQTSGVAKFTGSDVVFTASGGSFGPFRYAVVYNDTAASDQLIGYIDHGSSISVTAPDSYTFDIDATNGLFTNG